MDAGALAGAEAAADDGLHPIADNEEAWDVLQVPQIREGKMGGTQTPVRELKSVP